MPTGTRDALLDHLANVVAAAGSTGPTRVAIDGPPAAGKTTLADELAAVLRQRGREVARASIDDYLTPPAIRYARGEFSGEGCYRDAHDLARLNRELLDPLGRPTAAGPVLLFDGVFLLRPELIDRWEVRIFVSIPLEQTIDRAVLRERGAGKERADVERRWRERYLPAQELYAAEVQPFELADVVVHNDDPTQPRWDQN